MDPREGLYFRPARASLQAGSGRCSHILSHRNPPGPVQRGKKKEEAASTAARHREGGARREEEEATAPLRRHRVPCFFLAERSWTRLKRVSASPVIVDRVHCDERKPQVFPLERCDYKTRQAATEESSFHEEAPRLIVLVV